MNSSQVKKQVAKLKKIRGIIEVSKFVTMQEISRVTRIAKNSLEISMIAKDIFTNAHKKFGLNSSYINSKGRDSKLFIYVSFPKTLLAASYEKQEFELLRNFRKGQDKLITVGEIATNFAVRNDIKPEIHIEDTSFVGIEKVSSVIVHMYDEGYVSEVNFVLHTSRTADNIVTILPVTKLQIKLDSELKHEAAKRYYPSMAETMENLSKVYVIQCATAIFHEAHYFHLKEKLIRHEESIKSVDERVALKWSELIKTQRKVTTEEIILINQNTSRTVNSETVRRKGGKNA